MAGPGIRYLWFARELARRGYDVTLVVPFATDLAEPGFEIVVDNPWHAGRMTRLAKSRDAVVAQRLPVPTMLALARSATRAVYDLYAPLTIEHCGARAPRRAAGAAAAELDQLTLRVALETRRRVRLRERAAARPLARRRSRRSDGSSPTRTPAIRRSAPSSTSSRSASIPSRPSPAARC